jgi:hypothetical protein
MPEICLISLEINIASRIHVPRTFAISSKLFFPVWDLKLPKQTMKESKSALVLP